MRAGLRSKMLVPTLAVVILCMGLSGYFSAKKAADELRASMISSASLLAKNLTKGLGIYADDLKGAVVLQAANDRIIRALKGLDGESNKDALAALTGLTKFDESIQSANLLDAQGETVLSSDPQGKGNFADREYFKKAMAGTPNISEPLLSRVTNRPVFIVAAPVTIGGKAAGVLYIRVDLGKFSQEMVAPVKVGQNGYAYMADRAGLLFSHPDADKILKLKISDFDWGRTMLAAQHGVTEYEFEGSRITGVFSKEESTGWLAVIVFTEGDIEQATSAVRNTAIMLGIGGILLVSVAIWLILNTTLNSLGRCVSFAREVAGGSLDAHLDEKRDDELGNLADSIRTMVASLKDMLATAESKTKEAQAQSELANSAKHQAEEARLEAVRAKAEGMCQAATRLESVVGVVTAASQELSRTIDDSSAGADRQSQRLTETATAMEEMNATVLEVSRNSANAATTTDQARAKAQEGSAVVGRVVEAIARVRDQAETLKGDMGTLGQQAQDIGRIMNVINDIADQTNLLALNAAIEAARAGDAGRGFAVVADEVRKLAEKTMQATKEVGEAIQGIQQGTSHNVRGVEEAVSIIHEANGLANQSGESLRDIVAMTDHASDQVRSIATAAEEQSAASEEISRAIDDVSETSQETSRAMNQAAKAVSEMAHQAQVLKHLIEELETEGQMEACVGISA